LRRLRVVADFAVLKRAGSYKRSNGEFEKTCSLPGAQLGIGLMTPSRKTAFTSEPVITLRSSPPRFSLNLGRFSALKRRERVATGTGGRLKWPILELAVFSG